MLVNRANDIFFYLLRGQSLPFLLQLGLYQWLLNTCCSAAQETLIVLFYLVNEDFLWGTEVYCELREAIKFGCEEASNIEFHFLKSLNHVLE